MRPTQRCSARSSGSRSFRPASISFNWPQCPLCDTSWNVEALKSHLHEKLQKSAQAQATRDRVVDVGDAIAAAALRLREHFSFIGKLPELGTEFAGRLQHWAGELLTFAQGIKSFDGAMAAKERIQAGWATPPNNLVNDLKQLQSRVKARPDKSATEQARSFLVIAQERLAIRRSRRSSKRRRPTRHAEEQPTIEFCDISEEALTSLYEQVEGSLPSSTA